MKVFAGVACVLALSGVALAQPVDFPSSDPVQGNSWTLNASSSNWANVDFIGFSMNTPGATFEAPLFSNPSIAGWGVAGNYGSTPTIFAASGPAFVNFGHTMHFAGDVSDPVTFDRYFFSGDTLLGVFTWTWDGNTLTTMNTTQTATLTREDFEMAVIPLPSAAAMALFGMAAVGSRRQRSVA